MPIYYPEDDPNRQGIPLHPGMSLANRQGLAPIRPPPATQRSNRSLYNSTVMSRSNSLSRTPAAAIVNLSNRQIFSSNASMSPKITHRRRPAREKSLPRRDPNGRPGVAAAAQLQPIRAAPLSGPRHARAVPHPHRPIPQAGSAHSSPNRRNSVPDDQISATSLHSAALEILKGSLAGSDAWSLSNDGPSPSSAPTHQHRAGRGAAARQTGDSTLKDANGTDRTNNSQQFWPEKSRSMEVRMGSHDGSNLLNLTDDVIRYLKTSPPTSPKDDTMNDAGSMSPEAVDRMGRFANQRGGALPDIHPQQKLETSVVF